MSGLQLDFVLYLGDPDEGAEAVTSVHFLERVEEYKAQVDFPEAYGAVTFTKDGTALCDPVADPIFGLVTNLVRTVHYVLDGDPETMQFSESEHGLGLEPEGDQILVSLFQGDPYDPEEFLVESESMSLEAFGDQVLAMGRRLKDILDKVSPGAMDEDDYLKGLSEFLEVSGDSFKTFRLAKQRGLRV